LRQRRCGFAAASARLCGSVGATGARVVGDEVARRELEHASCGGCCMRSSTLPGVSARPDGSSRQSDERSPGFSAEAVTRSDLEVELGADLASPTGSRVLISPSAVTASALSVDEVAEALVCAAAKLRTRT
jgi:hypothetical protein